MTAIQNSTAVVTGSQRGLGKAFAEELLRRGARKVYVTARQPTPNADSRIIPVALELADPAAVTALAAVATDATIVINNAGVFAGLSITTSPMTEIEDTVQTNFLGPVRVIQAFAPILARNGGGAIITMNSFGAWASGAGIYGATKAALWSVTNSLRTELESQGTQVLGVHVGNIDTDMIMDLDAEKHAPSYVAAMALDALENDESELLVDAISRAYKAALPGPVQDLVFAMA